MSFSPNCSSGTTTVRDACIALKQPLDCKFHSFLHFFCFGLVVFANFEFLAVVAENAGYSSVVERA